MKHHKPGTIVFARLPGHKVWWPGQIANATEASDEALYKQLPGHSLVCLYGNYKWAWLPAQRIMEYEAGCAEFARKRSPSQMWQQAWDEAKEAFDRSKGRPVSGKYDPPFQLRVRPSQQPVAGADVLFGVQQHPRAQALMVTLQKGAVNHASQTNAASKEASRNKAGDAAAGPSSNGASVTANGGQQGGEVIERTSSRANRDKVVSYIPAWPEYLAEAAATESDVRAVSGSDALAWLRSLARGTLPAKVLTPEQEVAARQQLTSLDLVRRQTALTASMQQAAAAHHSDMVAGVAPSSPRQTRRSSKGIGLQPGTHSLGLPEDVARALAPVQHVLRNELPQYVPPQPAQPPQPVQEGAAPQRRQGGGNVVGAATVDLVLRVNGQVLPYTTAITVQVITIGQPPVAAPGAAPAPGPPPVQFRVGGLHTVLQQLLPVPPSSSSGPSHSQNGSDTHGSGAVAPAVPGIKQERPAENGKTNEKVVLPGPMVEGWQAIGPHQVLMSLSVPSSLLSLTAPGRRWSANGSDAALAPRPGLPVPPVSVTVPAPVRSPSAALLATYGVALPSLVKRPSLTSPRVNGGSAVFKRPSNDTLTTAPSDTSTSGHMVALGPRQGASALKRLRTEGGHTLDSSSPAAAALARHRSHKPQPPKRPWWSSRVTPYDPSDPFSHPMLQGGAKHAYAATIKTQQSNPYPPAFSPTAGQAAARNPDGGGSGSMGPPQPRHGSSSHVFARRSSDMHHHHNHDSGSPPAEDLGAAGAASQRLAAALQVLQGPDSNDPDATGQEAAPSSAKKQQGVLLVDIQIGDRSKFRRLEPPQPASSVPSVAVPPAAAAAQSQPTATAAAQGSGAVAAQQGPAGDGTAAANPTTGPSVGTKRPHADEGQGGPKIGEHGENGRPLKQVRLERGLMALLQMVNGGKPANGVNMLGRTLGMLSQGRPVNGSTHAHLAPPATKPAAAPVAQGAQAPASAAGAPEKGTAAPGQSNQQPRQQPAPQGTPVAHAQPVAAAAQASDAAKAAQRASHPPLALTPVQVDAGKGDPRTGCVRVRPMLNGVTTNGGMNGPRPGDVIIMTPPCVSVPLTPQLGAYMRSQTKEGRQLQSVAAQLASAVEAVRMSSVGKLHTTTLTSPSALEALVSLREKAVHVASRVMVTALSPAALASGDAQLRSEPLQHLICAARDTLAACDAAAATHVRHAAPVNGTTAPPRALGGSLAAYAIVAGTASTLLMLLGGSGDDDEDSESHSESDSESDSESSSSSEEDNVAGEKRPRRLGLLGGLEQEEIEALQQMAQPLAAIAPAAAAALRTMAATPPPPPPVLAPVNVAVAAPAGPAAHSLLMLPPKTTNAANNHTHVKQNGSASQQPAVADTSHDAHVVISTCAGSAETANGRPHSQGAQANGSAKPAAVCVASPA